MRSARFRISAYFRIIVFVPLSANRVIPPLLFSLQPNHVCPDSVEFLGKACGFPSPFAFQTCCDPHFRSCGLVRGHSLALRIACSQPRLHVVIKVLEGGDFASSKLDTTHTSIIQQLSSALEFVVGDFFLQSAPRREPNIQIEDTLIFFESKSIANIRSPEILNGRHILDSKIGKKTHGN